jgi:hypothetical protein
MADLNTLRELCAKMVAVQENKAIVEEELSRINGELDDLRLKQIPEMMAEIEVKNATFPGIGRVQLATDLYCSTRAGRKDEAMQWLRDQELDNMITEGYNASSMKALIRKMIEQGVETPEFLNVTPFIRASIVKA